ncbi:Alpha/Beta hydrolase protein [Gorgonomyces haynaldii]|nr:Alpha/Beta hydrolase protein [Gorgonomyces haynaldii]
MESLHQYVLEELLREEPKERIVFKRMSLTKAIEIRTLTSAPFKVVQGLVNHSLKIATNALGSTKSKPGWNYPMALAIQLIQQYQQFGLASLDNVRYGIRAAETASQTIYTATPVWFFVNHQNLIRMESELDGELARYPIPKDYVKEQWHRLEGEWTYPKSKNWISRESPTIHKRKVIFFIHGGAFVFGSPRLYRHFITALSRESGFPVFSLDYRLAPEHPFPAAIHDAFASYLWLLNPHDPLFKNTEIVHEPYAPEDIILLGDSAGGNLCMALLNYMNHYIKNPKMPLGAMLLSPWMDLSCSSQSYKDNASYDVIPSKMSNIHEPITASFEHPVHSYCFGDGNSDILLLTPRPSSGEPEIDRVLSHNTMSKDLLERTVRHPLISPIFGDLKGVCPILIQVGDAELLRDECLGLYFKYQQCNADPAHFALLEVYNDMVHDFQMSPLPIARLALQRMVGFMRHLIDGAPIEPSDPTKFQFYGRTNAD